MALYVPNIWPLITSLQVVSTAKQCSFADDAGGTGSSTEIKRWWDTLSTLGPDFGFFPNDKKWWIDAKPGKKESVKEVFKITDIIVTMEGRNHLRAVIATPLLPQFGLKRRWTYFLRTLLENATSPVLIHIFAFQCPKMGTNQFWNTKREYLQTLWWMFCYAVQMFFAARRIVSKEMWLDSTEESFINT